jgi:HD-GYP domain
VAEYILAHHERWDGTGYPSGLKGEQVPLLCRILAVADAYDAMTNDRVYRKAIDSAQAEKELMSNAGKQFDPKIVGLFLETIR